MARICVVDDAPEVVSLITRYLQTAKHNVLAFTAATGLEDTLAREKPDLLLLDIVMPGRDGFQLLRSLRKRDDTKNLPVILVSSKAEPSDIEWGQLQGANAYLTKPFSQEQLLAVVEAQLAS